MGSLCGRKGNQFVGSAKQRIEWRWSIGTSRATTSKGREHVGLYYREYWSPSYLFILRSRILLKLTFKFLGYKY